MTSCQALLLQLRHRPQKHDYSETFYTFEKQVDDFLFLTDNIDNCKILLNFIKQSFFKSLVLFRAPPPQNKSLEVFHEAPVTKELYFIVYVHIVSLSEPHLCQRI